MGPFRNFPKTNPGKIWESHMLDHSPTCKIFKGDHWILPKLKQLVTKTNHNKSLIFLMAHVALRYTVKTRFANLHKIPFI